MPPLSKQVSQLQLIHLAAVNPSHSGGFYSVRGRIAFDFRDRFQNVNSFRLHPERPPASPAATATAIDVFLSGRWRAAARSISKHSLVQVDCPLVNTSADAHVNPVRLELADPMPQRSHSSHTALHILDDDRALVSTLAYPVLDFGFVNLQDANGTPPTPAPVPWAAPSSRTSGPTRVSVGESTREYTYTPIARLWDMTAGMSPAPSRDEKVNVYGVVVDCRAPCTTRGPDLRCEVIVADESSLQDGSGELRTMAIYRFERDPADCIPFRSVGDVIRAHRVNYGRYHDHHNGTSTVQGVARFYSTFLLWSLEGTDFLPVASRDPVRPANQEQNPARAVTHIVTSQDREKISSLRSWAQNHLFKVHKVHRPYLRTVIEVKSAHSTSEFLSKSFDLLCRVEADVTDETNSGTLKFVVSDGLRNTNAGAQRLFVESTISSEHMQKAARYPFVAFCPSWGSRPSVWPAWLLIRDVKATTRGPDRTIQLSVGKKTSTLVWHPDSSPDVCKVKESFNRATGIGISQPVPPVIPPVSRSINLAAAIGALPASQGNMRHEQTATAGQHQQPIALSGQRGSNTHGALMMSGTHQEPSMLQKIPGHFQRTTPTKRVSSSVMPGVGALLSTIEPLRKVPRTNAAMETGRGKERRNDPSTRHFEETRLGTLRRDMNQNSSIISDHSNKQSKVSTIADLQKAVMSGSLTPHRLQASARSCISPRDVRFACRPWCSKCNKFLRVDPNHGLLECLSCSDKFSSTGDPKTEWAYLVRLNLEDCSGSRIECWIEGKEATLFFTGLPPTSLLSNTEARQRVSKYLQAILSPMNQLDCCVKPYEYEDKHGVYQTSCKVFATALLPAVFSG